MNNKDFEKNLKELNVDDTHKKSLKKEKFTTTLDKDMLDDYKEFCKALNIRLNEGIEMMFWLLYNNKNYLKDFLKESGRL